MWGFLKKLFAKEEKKETVDFFELEKRIADEGWKEIKQDIEKLQNIREAISKNIEALQAKDIDSEKVQDKAKDVIKGNRNAFVIMLRKLAESIDNPELNAKGISVFCKRLEEEMADFHAKTARNYFIMKTLIGEELEAIKQNLKEAEAISMRLKKAVETGKLAAIEDLQQSLRDIYQHIESKGKHEKEMQRIEKETGILLSKEKEVTGKINAMKEGKGFAELEKLKARLQQKTDEEAGIKARIRNSFAELARPLRKYEKAYPSKVLAKYLQDPVAAMEENNDIANVLHSAAESMLKGEIDSKNKEKDVQNLEELSSKFDELKERLMLIEKEKEEVKGNIRNNKAEEERDKMIEELNRIEGELSDSETRLEELKKKDVKKDIEKVKEDLKKMGMNMELRNVPYE